MEKLHIDEDFKLNENTEVCCSGLSTMKINLDIIDNDGGGTEKTVTGV